LVQWQNGRAEAKEGRAEAERGKSRRRQKTLYVKVRRDYTALAGLSETCKTAQEAAL
jgi:hypothetical protein